MLSAEVQEPLAPREDRRARLWAETHAPSSNNCTAVVRSSCQGSRREQVVLEVWSELYTDDRAAHDSEAARERETLGSCLVDVANSSQHESEVEAAMDALCRLRFGESLKLLRPLVRRRFASLSRKLESIAEQQQRDARAREDADDWSDL